MLSAVEKVMHDSLELVAKRPDLNVCCRRQLVKAEGVVMNSLLLPYK